MYGGNLTHVYDELDKEVKLLVNSMTADSGDAVLDSAQNAAREVLSKLSAQISEECSKLKRNTTWDRYTIAFYGETNAGKSAIIETLRILLSEETKLQEREKYRRILSRYNQNPNQIAMIQGKYEELKNDLKDVEQKYEKIKITEFQKKSPYLAEIERLNLVINDEYVRLSLWKKIIKFLLRKKSESELKKQELKEQLSKIEDSFVSEKKNIEVEINTAKNAVNEIEKENREVTDILSKVKEYADGTIIGTGISDFTQKNVIYSFDVGGVAFDLIDVPGIEGNESIVKDSILEAVQKAHAVFYVTRKAAAPQTGDGYEGTLEKIKKHLGAQTQVWTIFNQSVTNPLRLTKELISDDEMDSLHNLDEVMTKVLGAEHYRGTICLSAYPAFLSVAECLVPNSKICRDRKKFTDKFGMDEILKKTKMEHFIQQLPYDIVGDWKKKIIESNLNKAKSLLEIARSNLSEIEQHFAEVNQNLIKTASNTILQLDMETVKLHNMLKKEIYDNMEGMLSEIRREMYEKIENEKLKNEDLKEKILKDCVSKNITIFDSSNEKGIKKSIDEYCESVCGIVDNFASRIKEYFDPKYCSNKISNIDFSVAIDLCDIKSGIKFGEFVEAMVGILIIFLYGLSGWGLALALVGVAYKIICGVREFFSLEYKRKRQKEYVEKCLTKIKNDMSENINDSIAKITEDVRSKNNELKEQLTHYAQIAKLICNNLSHVQRKVQYIGKNLQEADYE